MKTGSVATAWRAIGEVDSFGGGGSGVNLVEVKTEDNGQIQESQPQIWRLEGQIQRWQWNLTDDEWGGRRR